MKRTHKIPYRYNKKVYQSIIAFSLLATAQFSIAEYTLEEVTVTARKKPSGETIQGVPIAIMAVSGDTIDSQFMRDLTDLGNIVPNAQLNAVGTMPGTANFSIRGMGVFGSIPSDEATVGIISDGIYLGVNSGALVSLFDVEAVEVLRGPQGTLFGRNVTAGAIVINSRRPTKEFEGKVASRIGSDGQYKLDSAVGGALSDHVLARIALGYQTNDDYFDNISGPDRGEASNKYIRPMLTLTPNEDLSVALIGEYRDFKGDGVISKNRFDTQLKDHQLSTDLDGKGEYETKQFITDVDWSLGEGNLRMIAGWRDTHTASESDADGRNFVGVHSFAPWTTNQSQVSLELRYFTPVTEKAELTVGLYYFDQDIEYIESRAVNGAQLVSGQAISGSSTVFLGAGGLMEHNSLGIFGQTDIFLSEQLTLTLGSRYTSEEKDAQVANFGSCDALGQNCNYTFQESKSWDFFSGYAGLKWEISEDDQAYSSWTRSYRSGGFNLRVAAGASPGPYDEEQVIALEVGLKSDWLDGRMRTNMALFHNEYKDLQKTILSGGGNAGTVQTKLNAAKATIKGIELELITLLTQNLRLSTSIGYIDAGYDQLQSGSGFSVGNDFNNAPELTGNISLSHSYPLDSIGAIDSRVSYTYTDEQYADDNNVILLDSYSIVDASIAYTLPGEKITISLYAKNLTDEEYTNFALPAPLNTRWGIAPPRRYGLEASYKF